MAITIDPTVPLNSEVASQGASRIRTVAGWIQQMFGDLGTSLVTYTLPPFPSVDKTTGLVTVQGDPTVANGIANKGYVDAVVGATGAVIFTSGAGVFTTAAAVAYYRVLVIGAGGGGDHGTAGISGGGGGGSGGINLANIVGGGAAYNYSVGAGGTGGVDGGAASTNGAASTVISQATNPVTVTANGGKRGIGSSFGDGGTQVVNVGIFDANTLVVFNCAGRDGQSGQFVPAGGAGAAGFSGRNGGNGGTEAGSGSGAAGSNGMIIFFPGV